jgi:hypothetical protein
MYKVTEKTKGIPGSCLLQTCSEYGSYEECFATGSFCKVDGGVCPFDDDDIIQLEFKKEK